MSKKVKHLRTPLSTTMSIMNMAKTIQELNESKKRVCEMAARSILYALDCRDHYTFGHSMRVAYFSLVTGKEYGLNDEKLYELEMAALFHDIGKIGIPDSILNKPQRLDEEEFLIMKKHPEISAEILRGFEDFRKIAHYARHHHERYDGRGYPKGLKGNDIPLFSRMILIADTFDAMTSSRPYRKGLPFDVAFEELIEFSGSQFDAELVRCFVEGMKKEEKKGEKKFHLSIMGDDFEKEAA